MAATTPPSKRGIARRKRARLKRLQRIAWCSFREYDKKVQNGALEV